MVGLIEAEVITKVMARTRTSPQGIEVEDRIEVVEVNTEAKVDRVSLGPFQRHSLRERHNEGVFQPTQTVLTSQNKNIVSQNLSLIAKSAQAKAKNIWVYQIKIS